MRPADLGVAPLPQMTRPVHPWPATAAFTGQGAWADAANGTQGPDAGTLLLRDWAGADFLAPYLPQDQADPPGFAPNLTPFDPWPYPRISAMGISAPAWRTTRAARAWAARIAASAGAPVSRAAR